MKKESVILSVGNDGLRGFMVYIETVVRRGIFQFDIVGLANKTVAESKQRILSAIQSCDIEPPRYSSKKIVTLLSPADDKKEGSHFDLPITISYLTSSRYIKVDVSKVIFIGELTLYGQVRQIKNLKALVATARGEGFFYFIIPHGQREMLDSFRDIYIYEVEHLLVLTTMLQASHNIRDLYSHFKSNLKDTDAVKDSVDLGLKQFDENYLMDSIEGLEFSKRALLIALAGKHHIVFIGQPGIGKSLLAKSAHELIQSEASPSVPFREPHHTSNYSAILGNKKSEGDIILANRGILFFDELVEFDRRVLESMRQPLEDGYVIHPDLGKVYSDFIFIGSMNPCGCGYANSKEKRCVCSRNQIERHERKIRSPLFDRIDMKVNVYRNDGRRNNVNLSKNSSAMLKAEDVIALVLKVRKMQRDRILNAVKKNNTEIKGTDILMRKKELKMLLVDFIVSGLPDAVKSFLFETIKSLRVSKREENSLILIIQTIADLDAGNGIIKNEHVLEALSYR